MTARTVLSGVALTAADPGTSDRVPDELATYARSAMRAMGGRARLRIAAFRWAPLRHLFRLAERSVLPGIAGHYVARKNAIHALALRAAVDQLVVLGAGYDGLAWRIARSRPEVKCIEVDHSGTQSGKRALLEALPAADIAFVPADLSSTNAMDDLFRSLAAGRTLFVAEGLLMYLPEEVVGHLLRAIAARPGAQAVLSLMTLDGSGRPNFLARPTNVSRYLARAREPFLSGVSMAGAAAYLRSHGLTVHSLLSAENTPGMIAGEYLVHASARVAAPAAGA